MMKDENSFNRKINTFLLELLILSLTLFGLHSFLQFYLFNEFELFYPLWIIYIFHFFTVLFIYAIIYNRYTKGKKEVFNMFMLLTVLKTVAIIIFLLPLLISDLENKKPDVINFFITYFLFLAFEVYSISKVLQR